MPFVLTQETALLLSGSFALGMLCAGVPLLWMYLGAFTKKSALEHHITTIQEKLNFYQHQLNEYQQREKEASSPHVMKEVMDSACQRALSGFQSACVSVLQPAIAQWNQTHTKEQRHVLAQTASPIGQALEQVLLHLKNLEHERVSTYEHLKYHIAHMEGDQKELALQTQNLVTALRSPHVRGSWGELQLRRVLELSGMLEHCDFEEQFVLKHGSTTLRPDVVIRLTQDRYVIIDAKAPILHYLEACNASDTKEYTEKLQDHTRLLSQHIKKLSEKAYPKHCPGSVDFVLLFVPGDHFLSAALGVNPALTEWASERNVILTSPSLLIALLKTIAHGWRQERLAQHTQHIMNLGAELLKHCGQLEKKFDQADRALRQSSEHFSAACQVLKHRVMNTAHQLESCAHAQSSTSQDSTTLSDLQPKQNLELSPTDS
jgi:DNA recombination protein RmuC